MRNANWKQSLITGGIRAVVVKGAKKLAADNTLYVATVAKVVNFCGRQAIALRGHGEHVGSDNKGNFLELLDVLSRHDTVVNDKLRSGRTTPPSIQNELLEIHANLIHGDICAEIREAGFYAVMADESRDLGKHEQISITCRYFREGKVQDAFLEFAKADSLTAESLSEDILTVLRRGRLPLEGLVASVMSGSINGVHAHLARD